MKLTLLRHNIVRGSVIFVSLTAKFAFGRALPPIHFGREVPFYTLLGHSRCQSDFDELVSMASRPEDRRFRRMAEPKVPFRPVKSLFGRMGTSSLAELYKKMRSTKKVGLFLL